MNWETFVEEKIKPLANELDAWDTTILESLFNRSSERVVMLDVVKRYVVEHIGFISNQDLHDRLEKLEDLGLITRKIGLV